MSASSARPKVAHLTSVHAITDPRILYKECASLAALGYDVVLIAPHHRAEVVEGVRIRPVPRERGRVRRMTRCVWNVYRAAVAEDCDVYHFHDPELIPVGLALRLRGKPVVYDVHEDYRTSIAQKPYLPRLVRGIAGAIFGALEQLASRAFRVVLAERYYQRRFGRGQLVLNYPLGEEIDRSPPPSGAPGDPIRLLYTGGISEDRGALIHARIPALDDRYEVHMIGRCDPALATRMRALAGPAASRLIITGEGYHVPYAQILDAYRQGGWTAGLALFPDTPHYRDKELTKFFEYMAAGVPVVCSDFDVWRALIEDTACGITVDPYDVEGIRTAIEFLRGNPEEAVRMGSRGRDAVATRFNWAREAGRLAELYGSMIESAPVRVRSPASS